MIVDRGIQGPTFCGQPPDRGLIVVGETFPQEGYAILSCGNTQVKIGYTTLHNLGLYISPIHSRDQQALQDALYSITCEASLGRTGDDPKALKQMRPVDITETIVKTIEARKLIYEQKREKVNALAEGDFNQYDKIQHTVEAFDNLLIDLQSTSESKPQ